MISKNALKKERRASPERRKARAHNPRKTRQCPESPRNCRTAYTAHATLKHWEHERELEETQVKIEK